jgi:hypothetical protein
MKGIHRIGQLIQRLDELENRGIWEEERDFPLLQSIETGSEAHPASFRMGTEVRYNLDMMLTADLPPEMGFSVKGKR